MALKELIHACVIRQITQHIRYGLTPLPLGTLLPSVATSYMLETLYEIPKPAFEQRRIFKGQS
ncbi:MAG: hypothetical protein COT45_05885 [bacterium (Candidatus Stahlbacteria) CG08_land_8_20_14_0_20_40_26]|nr:MAG: hypothetical protein COX49_04760 [bacterium (Candidatus Stahlbacteria) CG23_combo_of_CG06-09_8_20_14_all_40_9]PIS23596.1 MAG: hypothetical protein COT45_05885 [bacterium (Candidatus Stahlbacteria) CG08_land_8_20_14_0_20_40_26]